METQDITHCGLQMRFSRMASVCLPLFFLLFVLGWQSWPLISILPIMQMRTDHILVQTSRASAEARSPLGPSGNLHFKAILCDKTMAQVLCPWPRALSSPARQKVGVTPVSPPLLSAPGPAHSVQLTTEYRRRCQNEFKVRLLSNPSNAKVITFFIITASCFLCVLHIFRIAVTVCKCPFLWIPH